MVEQVEQEHTNQSEPVGPIDSDVVELTKLHVPLQVIPHKVHNQPDLQDRPVNKPEIYTPKMKRPNPL